MKLLIKYTRLHNDNYQGASGVVVHESTVLVLDNKRLVDAINSAINHHLEFEIKRIPFQNKDSYPTIIGMELFK